MVRVTAFIAAFLDFEGVRRYEGGRCGGFLMKFTRGIVASVLVTGGLLASVGGVVVAAVSTSAPAVTVAAPPPPTAVEY
jgi:hypothetical protein